ncbi:MAG: hypothetical protein HQL15_11085, partial [Candidatus Omnitrophica bacterium]|nr:hypothetical protein [Candidatus Omnitrophota bacterium]
MLGNTGFDFADVVWLGSNNNSNNWSDPNNWDGGFTPGIGDYVLLTENLSSPNDVTLSPPNASVGGPGVAQVLGARQIHSGTTSVVDPAFLGAIAGLKIDPSYSGSLVFGRSLFLVGNRSSYLSGHFVSSPLPNPPHEGEGISISSVSDIIINGELTTEGNTTFASNKDILVNANITTINGNLNLLAEGSFQQKSGTTITTVGNGDITIQSSGEGTIGNIVSAGNLILISPPLVGGVRGGGVFFDVSNTPLPNPPHDGGGNQIVSVGQSLIIGAGVTLNANDALFLIGQDWINEGIFSPQTSTVILTGPLDSIVSGDNTFYNFVVSHDSPALTLPTGRQASNTMVEGTPVNSPTNKTGTVYFDPQFILTIVNNLILKGSYGHLLELKSLTPGEQWKLNVLGQANLSYLFVGDSISVRGPPLKTQYSSTFGHLTNWDTDPYWTGAGSDSNWSTAANWDTGTTPTPFDDVTFDGTNHGVNNANPQKDSIMDQSFTVHALTINGYTGTLSLAGNLNITQDFILASGIFNAFSSPLTPPTGGGQGRGNTVTIGGNWTHSGGIFNAGNSTVIFNDPTQTSNILGDNTFYNLVINNTLSATTLKNSESWIPVFAGMTSTKTILFDAGKTQTIVNNFTVQGAYGQEVRLLSSIFKTPWMINPQGLVDINA